MTALSTADTGKLIALLTALIDQQAATVIVSPYGTGVSRYVDVLTTADGLLAIWQQGQPDGSQPSVSHFLPMTDVARLLA